MRRIYLLLLFVCYLWIQQSLAQKNVVITGFVKDSQTNKPLKNVLISVQNSNYSTTTSINGYFKLIFPEKKRVSLLFSLLSYQKKVKEIELAEQKDSLFLTIDLIPSYQLIDSVAVYASLKPDTLVGAPDFGVYDFDFYENKYILLTAEKSLKKAAVKLADESGKILTTYFVPQEGGAAKEFFKDYEGYTNLICENYIYRISIYLNRFVLTQLTHEDVNAFIKPIIDTANGKIIFSDYWKEYPMFNYFNYNPADSVKQKLQTIENKDLMEAYNFEYYALKPREKLEARRIAMDYKTDKRIIAAMMSGFTKSMFYEPLYAPLYVVKDTICVFDHYKDLLFHFDKNGQKLDSVSISYNHPKNWKEWKHLLLKDEIENAIYAVYDKNGHKYIKQINYVTGKELGKYNLQFHSADKLKVYNGYAYYIYRPFESTQERFFYRELIKLEK